MGKRLTLYITSTYLFSLMVRLLLYYQISETPTLFYNGEIIPIWTPDSGLYGYYAQQLLDGVSYPFVSEYTPAYLLYGVVKLFGVDLNMALFLVPAFFASLIVIPIILIAHHYKMTKLGVYGGIIGALMTSYYYRTHLGYYDTDMLNGFFPLMSIYFLIRLVDAKRLLNGVYALIFLILFYFWYHSSMPIILTILGVFFVYIAIQYRDKISKKYFISILVVAILGNFLLNGYFTRAIEYINKDSSIVVQIDKREFKFKSDLDIVNEASGIGIAKVIERVSGYVVFFLLSILGYILLVLKYRSAILTLPLLIITFLSMVAGLRFTMYGVPLLAFSMVFGVFTLFHKILVDWGEFEKRISNIVSTIFVGMVIIFSITKVLEYNSVIRPVYFSSPKDIKALESLKGQMESDDFILNWWNYSWPLWYYVNRNCTLIDNGKHQQDNFIISKIFLSDNQTFVRNSSLFFTKIYKEGVQHGFPKAMDYFLKKYSIEYLKKLENGSFKPPPLGGDIYILLHQEMFALLPILESFSNIDLKNGKNYESGVIDVGYLINSYKKSQSTLETMVSTINLKNGVIEVKGLKNKIYKIYIVEDGKMEFQKNYYSPNRDINVVIYNGKVLILNRRLFNSFLVQALVFNKYNRDYFDMVAKGENFIILKVKK